MTNAPDASGPPWPEPSLEDRLWQIEVGAWQALAGGVGAQYFDQHMTRDALLVVPGGRITRNEAISAIAGGEPWQTFHLAESEMMQLSETSAVVSYLAIAQLADSPEFRMWVTSTYKIEDGIWKLAVYHQTPQMDQW